MLDYIMWIVDNWQHIASVALGICVMIIILLMSVIGTAADIGSSVIKNIRG